MKLRTAKKICKRASVWNVTGMCRYERLESAMPGWTQCFTGYSRRQIYAAIRRVQRWERKRQCLTTKPE